MSGQLGTTSAVAQNETMIENQRLVNSYSYYIYKHTVRATQTVKLGNNNVKSMWFLFLSSLGKVKVDLLDQLV